MPLNEEQILTQYKKRLSLAKFVILFSFFLLIFRLFYLQIVKGHQFALMAENNRLQVEYIPAPRGKIFDAFGHLLAGNQAHFCLLLYPQKMSSKDVSHYAHFLSKVLKCPLKHLIKQLKNALKCPLSPVYISQKLSWKQVTRIEASSYFFPALKIVVKPMRYYPYHQLAAHVLGYMGLITAKQLKSGQFPEADASDFVGQMGLEKFYQKVLCGHKGQKYLEVDALGRILKIFKEIPPIPGDNLYLTVDLALQQKAQSLLKGKSGAIVALDPHTGFVLAMASSPDFDPNLFIQGLSAKTWSHLINNPNHPLENRATLGLYPPGSVFKPVTALAGLHYQVITPQTQVFCKGFLKLGNHIFRCWKKTGHGWVNLYKAIVESCDVYFYQLGMWLGIDKLADYAVRCGFGKKTGITLEENSGLVPNRSWKWRIFKRDWHQGETLNVAIGQGALMVTPIQIAQFYAALANGGKIFRPQLVQKITDYKGQVIKEAQPILSGKLPATSKEIQLIVQALKGVMNNPVGTGFKSRSLQFTMAGKTGTAQVVSLPKKKAGHVPLRYKDHAWFAGFAPVSNPRIVVVVLIEHGGSGGAVAEPIARDLVDFYLKRHAS